jgi:hypothetical protein
MIKNKINTIPIGLYLIWIVFVLYYFFFKVDSFSEETPCGAGYLIIGLPILTPIIALIALLIIALINLFSKQKYYTDFEYISIPLLILLAIFILKIFV